MERTWIDFASSEVSILKAKFDKPRTVLLLPESAEALRSMPRRTDEHPQVFRSKRGLPIASRSAHYWAWSPVRAAFWATVSEQRRREIVDLDWHSLRHFCGWHLRQPRPRRRADRLPARPRRREAGPRPLRPRPHRRAGAAQARCRGKRGPDPCHLAATCGRGDRMTSGVHPLLYRSPRFAPAGVQQTRIRRTKPPGFRSSDSEQRVEVGRYSESPVASNAPVGPSNHAYRTTLPSLSVHKADSRPSTSTPLPRPRARYRSTAATISPDARNSSGAICQLSQPSKTASTASPNAATPDRVPRSTAFTGLTYSISRAMSSVGPGYSPRAHAS